MILLKLPWSHHQMISFFPGGGEEYMVSVGMSSQLPSHSGLRHVKPFLLRSCFLGSRTIYKLLPFFPLSSFTFSHSARLSQIFYISVQGSLAKSSSLTFYRSSDWESWLIIITQLSSYECNKAWRTLLGSPLHFLNEKARLSSVTGRVTHPHQWQPR